jgi:hypothetical protein
MKLLVKLKKKRAADLRNKAKARANKTLEQAHERRAADLRNKVKARANETLEQAHERRVADLRNKARARVHETPEQAHERREANLRNVTRHRANQTPAKIQETIKANSRIEEMVSIPRISEFVKVRDSKAKAFHHILKTRICHDEQLSHEILDFIQNKVKSRVVVIQAAFLYMNNVIKPKFVSVVIGLFAGLMNYIGLRKLLSFNKSQGLFYQIKITNSDLLQVPVLVR